MVMLVLLLLLLYNWQKTYAVSSCCNSMLPLGVAMMLALLLLKLPEDDQMNVQQRRLWHVVTTANG